MKYKHLKNHRTNEQISDRIQRINDDGSLSTIPFDPDNTDYQEYLKWVEEGNTAEAVD
tara:strand:- start:161 stop:334 length:174 start_codon:yes stop_codon:yes gene_type:complete